MEQDLSRRKFLDRFLTGVGVAFAASVLYPIVRYLIPPKSGEATVAQLKLPFGRTELEADPRKSKTFRFGRQLGIIILTPTGELKAVSAVCTHLDCTVQYRPDMKLLWCACHNGTYDLNGGNVSGPPPRPLEKFVVNEVGADIFVSKESA
jgi:Rieske Fe-S protein